MWENYRGQVGGTAFIDTNKCHIFPLGVPGLFRTYFAPADYIETVNTLGRRLYVKQYDMPNGKGVAYLFASLKIGIAASLVGAIVGELPTGAVAGLGARLLAGSYYGQTVQIWSALFAAAILAAALVGLLGLIERVTLRRMGMA